jgi:glycosyltransferase involved in cell wall biosynthesis
VKVLLVSYADAGGGAARAALRWHEALAAAGIISRMKVRVKARPNASIDGPDGALLRLGQNLRVRAGWSLQLLQRSPDAALRSANLVPSAWSRAINASDADVVHLHWLGNDTMSIADIGHISKPVVWTLHDMWAFCGSEHLADTAPSARWREGYFRNNRSEGDMGLDLDRLVWQRKREAWLRPYHLVTPSRWLGDCAASSALLRRWPCTTIPNVLDTARFAPMDQAAARRSLGLPETGRVLLFGGGRSDANKGYDLLAAALAELKHAAAGAAPYCVAFGGPPPAMKEGAPPIQWLGRFDDDERLARLYSAADVTVVPSRLENLPQIATEAQSCGCPVVAFSVGGLADAVEHEGTGFLARPYAPAELARGITWVLKDAERHRRLRESARARAVRLWSPAVVVPRLLDVYAAAIGARPAR